MNKTDLVNVVAQNNPDVAKKDVIDIVNATFDAMTLAMKDGDKVAVNGFGTFEVKATPERQGRNPITNEAITIPAGKKISFSAFKALKDTING